MTTQTTSETRYEDQQTVIDQFSPRLMLEKVVDALRFLASKWIWIIGIGLLFGLIAMFPSCKKKPTYAAEITFALDEGAAQSSKTEFAQLREALGYGSTLEAGGVFSSIPNILELLNSRAMFEKALRSSVVVDSGQKVVLADFFLDSLDYRSKWLRGAANDKPDFNAAKKSREDLLLQNRLLLMMYEKLRTENIRIDKKGKETTILSVACTSTNENFSKYFLETFIDQVTAYYVDIKTERAKKNLDFIQKRTDSMRAAYQSSLYGRAVTSDANTNPNFQVTLVPQENQQTDVQILKAAYSELARSQEAAKTTLNRSTPLIQYLDRPTLPLRMNTSKPWLMFTLGLLAGMLLTSLFLLLRRAYRSIMGIQDNTGDEWMNEYADYNPYESGSTAGDQPSEEQS